MLEWMTLVLLVPLVIVPIVLLFGFAGCQLVFQADTVMQMLINHASATPIPPSQRTELQIPSGLDEIVMACLAKNPSERPQSAATLSKQLAAVKVEAWDEEQAAAWWRMNR